MEAYKTKAVVSKEGSVTLDGLPFGEGNEVEVIVLSANGQREKKHGSLFGCDAGQCASL